MHCATSLMMAVACSYELDPAEVEPPAALSDRATPHVSLSVTRASSTIQYGTGARGVSFVVDKMRQALAAALAVPALWVSTVAFPITGLLYCAAIVALDGIELVARRLTVAPRSRGDS